MAERRHLEFDPHRQAYRIGVRLWEAGQAFNSGVDVAQIAMPHLQSVRDRLGETVQLAVLDGVDNIYIAKLDSFVGARLPAYATGIGKVLLAGLDDAELDERFRDVKLMQYTDETITDIGTLRQVLRTIRKQGFATDNGEYTLGVCCWAVPILDVGGKVSVAISTSIPSARLSDGFEETALAFLREAADQISTQLGYRAGSAAL